MITSVVRISQYSIIIITGTVFLWHETPVNAEVSQAVYADDLTEFLVNLRTFKKTESVKRIYLLLNTDTKI